jgi:hypothetical protein
VIWAKKEAENFCGQHWTGRIELIRQENFSSNVIPNCPCGAPQKPRIDVTASNDLSAEA